MTDQADTWLQKLAQMENDPPKEPTAPPMRPAVEKFAIHERKAHRRRVTLSTLAVVAMITLLAGYGLGAFVFSQSMSGTVAAAPVSGPTSFAIGNLPACNSACNGTLITGPNGYAIQFAVTAVNAGVYDTDPGFSSLWLVSTTVKSCGVTPNGIQVPSASAQYATGGAITVVAQSYNYCLFYTALSGGQTLSVSVTYSV